MPLGFSICWLWRHTPACPAHFPLHIRIASTSASTYQRAIHASAVVCCSCIALTTHSKELDMFGISPLGWVHTLGSLPAVPVAIYMFARYGRIVPRSTAGAIYFV